MVWRTVKSKLHHFDYDELQKAPGPIYMSRSSGCTGIRAFSLRQPIKTYTPSISLAPGFLCLHTEVKIPILTHQYPLLEKSLKQTPSYISKIYIFMPISHIWSILLISEEESALYIVSRSVILRKGAGRGDTTGEGTGLSREVDFKAESTLTPLLVTTRLRTSHWEQLCEILAIHTNS